MAEEVPQHPVVEPSDHGEEEEEEAPLSPKKQADSPKAEGQEALLDKTEGEQFPTDSKCQDGLWAALWIVQLLGSIALFAFYYDKDLSKNQVENPASILNHFYPIMGILVGSSFVVSLIMLSVITACAPVLIWFSFLASLTLLAAGAVVSFSAGQVVGGIIYAVFFVFELIYIFYVRHRIAFAVAMLAIVVDFVKEFKATIFVAFLGAVFQAGWAILWAVGAAYAIADISRKGTDNNLGGFIFFFLILSMYWTAQVLQNLVHVIVSGSLATWYYFSPANMPSNPTLKSTKRALTTSLGSVCLGSLIVAVIQAIRAVIQFMVEKCDNNFVRCCCICLLGCIQSLAQYFNIYAMSQIAIYGKSYCNAAKDTFELFFRRGFDFVINDDLIGSVLYIGALVGGLVVLGISLLLTNYGYSDMLPADKALWATAGFFIGFVTSLCSMVVVRSGVATFFVCFAEDAAPFASNQPEAYARLQKAWSKRYGDEVIYPASVQA